MGKSIGTHTKSLSASGTHFFRCEKQSQASRVERHSSRHPLERFPPLDRESRSEHIRNPYRRQELTFSVGKAITTLISPMDSGLAHPDMVQSLQPLEEPLTGRKTTLQLAQEKGQQLRDALPPAIGDNLSLLALAFVLSPRLFVIAVGFGVPVFLGMVWAESSRGVFHHSLLRRSSRSQPEIPHPFEHKSSSFDEGKRNLPPSVSSALHTLIGHVARDFIENWFSLINHSGSPAFPQAVQTSLNHACIEFGTALGNVNLTSQFIVPMCRSAVLHMREYREFEASSLDIEKYLTRNTSSPFNRHFTRRKVIEHLRGLSMLLCVKLLRRSDRSPIVFEFAHEIVATSVLLPVVDLCSNPDWINAQIVYYLKKSQEKAERKQAERKRTSDVKTSQSAGTEVCVKVLEARRLPIAGMNELYCSVLCGTEVQKTRRISAESSPIWMEEFQFHRKGGETSGVDGIVIDIVESRMIKDDIIGSVYIPFNALSATQPLKGWRQVDTSETRFAGVTNAELALEVTLSAPEVVDIDSLTGASTPITKSDLSPDDILIKNHALVEFMEYMNTIKAFKYVQLFIMIDSYNRFAQLELTGQPAHSEASVCESLRADAQSVLERFLDKKSPDYVDLQAPEMVAKVTRAVAEKPDADVLKPVQTQILHIIRNRYLEGFKESEQFKGYLAQLDIEPKQVPEQLDAQPGKASNPGSVAASSPARGTDAATKPYTANDGIEMDHSASSRSRASEASETSTSSSVGSKVNGLETFNDRVPTLSVLEAVGDAEGLAGGKPVESDAEDTVAKSIHAAAMALEKLENENTGDISVVESVIDNLREQVSHVDALMRRSTDPDQLADLASTKLQLQTQVEELADLVTQAEQQTLLAVDLRDIKINIFDNTNPELDTGEKNIFPFGGGMDPKSIQFIVQIERLNGGGWMVTKSYSDFVSLNDELLPLFPKIRKAAFPKRNRIRSQQNRDEVARDLERWAGMVIPDAAICESGTLQEFLKPENVQREESTARAQAASKVFGTFKSAGSLLRKVAVATPLRAATFVAGEVNAAVTGVAQGVMKAADSAVSTLPRARNSITSLDQLATPQDKHARIPERASSLKDLATLAPLSEIVGETQEKLGPSREEGRTSLDGTATQYSETTATSTVLSMPTNRSSSPVRPPTNSGTPNISPGRPLNPKASNTAAKPILTPGEVETILECIFGTVEEVFALSDPAQWMRQKGLHLAKTILRRTYGATISAALQQKLAAATSEETIAAYITQVDTMFWPEGIWYSSPRPNGVDADKADSATPASKATTSSPTAGEANKVATSATSSATSTTAHTPVPTAADIKREAKNLFIHSTVGLDNVSRVVGKYNAVTGMTRLFNMLQHRELNQHLVCEILDRVVKGVLEGYVHDE
ncbi:PXA domain-containing protein [Fimicolochytrium jonesii]|uniref:PXA domain-containing protein n=1 Tax=Fimicolochytrium jonesii TaxID=1396493 RepID=UPI0022FDEAF8|nr:PXA domain-containing protein [Fimicolochytrium jonesii]KAI8826723.1 PXA domain-containing protein [Fimicolochytrium jonesii]